MTSLVLRDATPDDFPHILALNAVEQDKTSPLGPARLHQLHAWSDYHKVALDAGAVVAFLLAMRDGSAYDSVNFRWFAARYPRFTYVDRIVVSERHAGRGIGRMLYNDLIAHARAHAQPVLACEYNIQPPNLASQAFHHRLGFVEVGRLHPDAGGKHVSMQVLALAPGPNLDGT